MKRLCHFIAAAFLITLMFGCGGSESQPTNVGPSPKEKGEKPGKLKGPKPPPPPPKG